MRYLMQLLADAEPADDESRRPPMASRRAALRYTGFGLVRGASARQRERWPGNRSGRRWASRCRRTDAGAGRQAFSHDELDDVTPLLALILPGNGNSRTAVSSLTCSGSTRAWMPTTRRLPNSAASCSAGSSAVAAIMLLASRCSCGVSWPTSADRERDQRDRGRRAELAVGGSPDRASGVARNLNLLIDSERARSERYRHTLDNLAHSLKTPLAAVRATLDESGDRGFRGR